MIIFQCILVSKVAVEVNTNTRKRKNTTTRSILSPHAILLMAIFIPKHFNVGYYDIPIV